MLSYSRSVALKYSISAIGDLFQLRAVKSARHEQQVYDSLAWGELRSLKPTENSRSEIDADFSTKTAARALATATTRGRPAL